jgi:hypothetical protein
MIKANRSTSNLRQGHTSGLAFFIPLTFPQSLYYIPFISPPGGISMAQKLDPAELVEFKELLKANSVQTDALAQLLIEKGSI